MYIVFLFSYNKFYISYLYTAYFILKQIQISFRVDYKVQISVLEKTLKL